MPREVEVEAEVLASLIQLVVFLRLFTDQVRSKLHVERGSV